MYAQKLFANHALVRRGLMCISYTNHCTDHAFARCDLMFVIPYTVEVIDLHTLSILFAPNP